MSQGLNLTIKLWEKQYQFVQANSRHSAFIAGIGSGKSVAGAAKMVREMMEMPGTGMIVAPTYKMLRDASLEALKQVAGDLIVDLNRTEMVARLVNKAVVLMRSADDPDHLRGPNISAIWIDEGSQIDEEAWLILLGRCREGRERIWVTTTPKGIASWLHEAFILNPEESTVVIRAKTRENPFLSKEFIHDVERRYAGKWAQQELDGEFVDLSGSVFQRDWFEIMEAAPVIAERVRYWDKAGTAGGGAYTCGILMAKDEHNIYYVEDVVRGQWNATDREVVIKQTAEIDAENTMNTVRIFEEQEPGSGGKESAEATIHNLAGFPVYADRVTGSKDIRLQPFAAQAGAKNVKLIRAPWNKEYIEELLLIPNGKYRDQADGSAGAFAKLSPVGVEQQIARATILRY